MILPLVEENLRQFWAYETQFSAASPWYPQKMASIATALSYLHYDLLAQDSRPMSGYHMDGKPENVLIDHGRFVLSDFGSSHTQPKESRQELPPHPGLGTYEPPECQLDLPQSQIYDIWSLGCIFLECTAWLMKGSSAIGAFAEDRLNDVERSGNSFKDDYFFTLELNESLTPVRARTRPAVIQWIRDLQRDPNCTETISTLLHLIEDGLLQVDQSERLKATLLSQRLELIHRSAAKKHLESGRQIVSPSTSEARVTEIED